MPDRLTKLGHSTAAALLLLRQIPEAQRRDLAMALARVMAKHLGPTERTLMAAAALMAAPPETVDAIAYDLGGPPPMGGV